MSDTSPVPSAQPRLSETFSRGLLEENPALRQMLGLCPTLAVTTAVTNGLGMGLATTFVLVCSEVVVSLLRRLIPSEVRIPAYITIIASFVTLVQMLVRAYLPALDDALGIYLPLIVVNCIVLGRAELFAAHHGPLQSAADGAGMGLGFTAALTLMSAIREVLGAGTLLGVRVLPSFVEPMIILVMPAGGFAVLGALIAASVWIEEHPRHRHRVVRRPAAPSASLCAACPINCGIGDPTNEACAKDEFVEMLEAAVTAARDQDRARADGAPAPARAQAAGPEAARAAAAAPVGAAPAPAAPANASAGASADADASACPAAADGSSAAPAQEGEAR